MADALATAAGKNIEARMQPLRGQTSIEAARSATNINKILDPIAQYTQNSKAAQQMLRILPESRISTNTLDVASKQARYYESVPSAKSFQSGMKGFDPLLQSIAKDFVSYTKSLSSTNPWVGKISGGIAEMVSAAAAPLQAQKLLPAAGQSNASRMTRSMFEGLPPIQAPSIGQEKAPLSRAATRSLNKARQLLGMSIGPTSPYAANPWAGSSTVPPVTPTAPSRALPPAGATSNYGVTAQRQAMAQAFQSYGFRQAPSIPPPMAQASTGGTSPPSGPPVPPGGGGAGAGGAGRRGGGIGGLNIPNLPGTGLVQELGTEFALAAKQVLLFGAAYKALAFLTGFPQQIGDAVGALQTFRNTLNTISPSAGEAAASSQFILDIVDKYNVPLQSARDGFTKLYASMQPAGFSGNEIRDLFLGISQSAASFGMSADKVDRVNYAFAQMASKGQVMSEELKGQLGDVLPGAMAIFAKAAGFKGPEAIKTFSKALEDGAYKGGAMKALLLNVGTIMRKEFGPGAEGAARTFQGSINRTQNSLKLLYESFEPVAIGFLNSVVMPMTAGLKTVTQGVTAYFKGQRAATPEAENFNKILQVLAPSLAGIGKNIAYALQQLLPLAQVVGAVALQVTRFLALPLVGYLAGAYLQVMLLTSGFSLLATSGLALATASMVRFIVQGVVAASVMVGLQRATQQTTVATSLFGQTWQTVMIKSVIGITLVAIGALIAKIMELRGQLAAVGGDARAMEDVAKSSAKMGNVEGTKEALGNIKDRLATFKKLQKELKDAKKTSTGGSAFSDRATINAGYEIGLDTARKLIELGVLNENVLTKTSNGYSLLESQMGTVNSLVNENVAEFEKAGQKGNILTDEAIRKNKQLRKQVGLLTIPPGEGAGDAAAKAAERAAKEAERLASQNQQLSIDAANRQNALDKTRFESLASLTDEQYQHELALIDSRNAYELTGRNSIEARQRKFQQDLLQVELRRINAVKKAQADVQKAQSDVTIATRTAQAAQGNETSFMPGRKPGSVSPARGSSFQGFEVTSLPGESRAYRNGTHEGYDFATPIGTALSYAIGGVVKSIDKIGRGNAGKLIEVTLDNGIVGLSMHLSEVMLEAGQRFEANQIIAKTGDTGAGPPHLHQESAAHAYRTGQAGASLAYLNIGKGNAQGARSSAVNTMQRREDKTENKAEVEQLQLLNTAQLANIAIRNSMAKAIEEAKTLIAQNIDTIYPVAEMQLENNLMKMRNNLQMQGMPSEYIDFREKTSKADYEGSLALEKISFQLKENENNLAAMQKKKADNVSLSAEEVAAYGNLSNAIEYLTEKVNKNKEGLASLEVAQKAFAIASLESAIATMKNADALKIQQDAIALVNSSVEGATNSYKGFVKEVMQGGDPTEALKKFQESLSDQVLTIFLDYAFKPVEDFLKDSLKNMLNLPTEEDQRKKAIADAEAQLGHLKTIDANVSTIAGQSPQAGTATPAATTAVPAAGGQAAGGPIPLTVVPFGGTESSAMSSTLEGAQSSISKSMEGITSSVEKSSFKLLEGVPPFEQALTIDLPGQVEKSTEALKAKGSTFNESLGKLTQGVGIAIGSIMGIAAGISQVKKGGTGNTLMGIGSVLASIGGAIGGFSKLSKAANGAVWTGGFQAFANGGTVKGPTLGLVGEGKYNEAIVPLPDGRSIPVQMKGDGIRDKMSGSSGTSAIASPLNFSFQTTQINGTEYVSREQLEMAMMETRRLASREGAQRGANLAIDKLQQSPNIRRRVGIR